MRANARMGEFMRRGFFARNVRDCVHGYLFCAVNTKYKFSNKNRVINSRAVAVVLFIHLFMLTESATISHIFPSCAVNQENYAAYQINSNAKCNAAGGINQSAYPFEMRNFGWVTGARKKTKFPPDLRGPKSRREAETSPDSFAFPLLPGYKFMSRSSWFQSVSNMV